LGTGVKAARGEGRGNAQDRRVWLISKKKCNKRDLGDEV